MLALDYAGQVGLAVLATEDQQIRLPMSESFPILDLGKPVLDRAVGRNERATRPAAVALLAPSACLQQMAIEPGFAAFGAVDIAVDGLMADRAVVASFMLEPSGDLLGRPAALEPGKHVAPGHRSAQLALPPSALDGQVWRSADSSRHSPAGHGSDCG